MKSDKSYILCIEQKKLPKKQYYQFNKGIIYKMNTMCMNSENGKTSDPHGISLNLTDKIYLRRKYKYIALSNLSVYYTWKNIKKVYKNNEFKNSAPTWNEEFELPDGSYSVSDIPDYFEYILKNKEKKQLILQFIVITLYIEVCFTDQNSNPVEKEDKINIALVIH